MRSFRLPVPALFRDRAAVKRITIVCVLATTAGIAYAFTLPPWYRSFATVVPAAQQRTAGASALSALGGLAAGLDSSLAGAADTARIAAVLQSAVVTDAVVAKFDLRARYRAQDQETAREALWSHCEVKTVPKPNLVQLSCEDKEAAFAQQLVAFIIEDGNHVFRRVSVTSASEEVRFLERRVAELRQQADESAAQMREFQEKHRIVDLDTQARAVVTSLAALNSQRISKQLELDYARTFSSQDEPTLRQLRSQLEVVGGKLQDLEANPSTPSKRPAGAAASMFPAALEVPKLRAEYEKLYRDRKVSEAVLMFSQERLEGAKANEARDVSTFLVLDPPTLAERKSRPLRRTIVMVFAVLGLTGSLAFEWFRKGGADRILALLESGPRRREGASKAA
jgi:capsule polysaccharide export protein KpsE/RkpR